MATFVDDRRRLHAADPALLAPSEAGEGPSMLDFVAAARADFEGQQHIVELAAQVLQATVGTRDEPTKTADGPLSCFESTVPCPLEPEAYLRRILQYTGASPCTILVGLIYLQRLREMDPVSLHLTTFNIQRLLLTAVMLACKFLDEPVVSNKQWALIGDISTREMNALELEMLWRLKFTLNITREEYDDCVDALVDMSTALQRRNSSKRPCGPQHQLAVHSSLQGQPHPRDCGRTSSHSSTSSDTSTSRLSSAATDVPFSGSSAPWTASRCQGSPGSYSTVLCQIQLALLLT
jgi:hypothetical protein